MLRLVPCLVCIVWTMVTTKVRLPELKVRIELITVRADETCCCPVRWLATPGVLYARARVPLSSLVARPRKRAA